MIKPEPGVLPRKTNTLLIAVALFALFAEQVFAQALPPTDIWLAPINAGQPGQAVKINSSTGYNNQPHFSNDGTVIYYTREVKSKDGASQTDIAAFHTDTGTTTMVTQTTESEYSPTPIPSRNALSVIQVEADQRQRLWAISTNNGEMGLLLPYAEPVGYHAWLNNHEVAMFMLGESFTLHIARIGANFSKVIVGNIGRTLRKHPRSGEILFVDKNTEPWQISAYMPATNSIRPVMPLFPASEDFTIDGDGNYWTGNGSRLYRRAPADTRWQLMADFSATGISNISRLAINPANNLIALVGDHNSSN